MIGSLRGTLLDRHVTELLVEVGGLGYRVQVTPATAAGAGDVGDETFLHVHQQVREDAQTLYGFTTIEDRRVFEVLIGTHGVGPALALAILSVHSPAELRRILATDDVAALCLVPGVGRKTAARLLVELKSRLDAGQVDPVAAAAAISGRSAGDSRTDVRDALAELGYGADEIGRVLVELPDDGDTSDLLREALQRLAAA
ncbi:Holliday junction branch migration protein RuvA [Dermatobacter hominis]|uniref:Holliday junction branch migration protein RuvA n=1 Tax=Dermatobacter hominis TaxID=2884263 RepID=UPI001D11AE35|nr:Holliday junction branch migration protein RuvA [Dermatobacter hominis]UDY36157.1 Holliday junction branch migration protein RuvA [Dermatobacter hominis]